MIWPRLRDWLRRRWWILAAGTLAVVLGIVAWRRRGARPQLGKLVEAQHESHMRAQMERWRLEREEREELQRLRAEYQDRVAENQRASLREVERLQRSPAALRLAMDAYVQDLYREFPEEPIP